MTGHLFVLRGDLTTLACSAVLVPCDDRWEVVTRHWERLLPADRLTAGSQPGWSRVRVDDPSGRFADMPGRPPGRRVRLVVTADGRGDIGWLVDGVVAAIADLAPGLGTPAGRVRPLVALPLVGTGAGGYAARRGAAIKALLPALRGVSAELGVDLALVLPDERDHAGVQYLRTDQDWSELDPALRTVAQDLGERAARAELSLFLGSGVSVPLGLPTWQVLLADLAGAAGVPPEPYEPHVAPRIAQALQDRLTPAVFRRLLVQKFTVSGAAPAHLLLAGLGVRQTVTTNYDAGYERALDAAVGTGSYRVLIRELPRQPDPWLLKLHGDVARPETIVLTADSYRDLTDRLSALHGLVQSLLLTSHLLFIGYGMGDPDFVEAAERVQAVREHADPGLGTDVATVLALHPGAVTPPPGFRLVPMNGTDDITSERLLEVFLDRLSWAASRAYDRSESFLLDDDYLDLFQEANGSVELRKLLGTLVQLPSDHPARRSPAWARVEQMLTLLGARPRLHLAPASIAPE